MNCNTGASNHSLLAKGAYFQCYLGILMNMELVQNMKKKKIRET